MGKNYKYVFRVIVIAIIVVFIAFIIFHQKSTYREANVTIENHAVVIAESLWSYDQNTSAEYLRLAAKSNHYKNVLIKDDNGIVFISIDLPQDYPIYVLLANVGLLPSYHLEKKIFHNSKTIGTISLDWQNRAVFTYLYIFLCLILLLIAIYFFLHLMTAKTFLEDRIAERTTALKESEDSLRLSEERLELALAGANDGIWDWDLANDSIHFDSRYYTMLGYEPYEFQSSFEEWEKRVHQDDLGSVKNAIDDYLLGKIDTFSQDFRLLNKKGNYQWIRGKGKIASYDSNSLPIRFIGTHSDINEHKLLEKARDDAYATINSSPMVAFIWKNEQGWPVEFVTENIEQVFGYNPDELLSSTIQYEQIIHLEDFERVGQEVEQFSSQKDCDSFVHKPYRIVTKSGELRWVDDRTYIKRNDIGEITAYHGVLIDATNRIEAEKAQLEANRMLKLVLNTIPVRVFWKDLECVYLGSNTAFAKDAGGLSPDDLVGKTDYDLAFSDQADLFRQDDIEVMRSGKSKIFYEEPQTRADGKTNWLLTSKVPMLDEQQNTIGVLGTYQDITDRKRAEEEVRNLRNYLANIIDSMPSVLIGVDNYGRVTQWNSKAQQITGVSHKLVNGQRLEEAFPRLSNELEQIKKAINMRQVCSDLRLSRKEDNQTRYEDVTIYPLTANGVEGAVIRVDDVTEKVHLEEMMVQSEKMLSVGGLAAGMAHEINNPLAGMIQTANVMKSRLSDLNMPANTHAADTVGVSLEDIQSFMDKRGILRMIETINDSGKRVAEIVDNMLSFARKTDETFSSHRAELLLDQILELASTDYDLKKQYDFKNIRIVKQYEENLPTIPCEAAKIQQVLLNILRNGAQAMQLTNDKDFQPCFILRLSFEEQTQMLRIEIEDNGPGMDSPTQLRVFEPFFTTKPVGVGTGLGLSVSYFIITQNHGGTMDVNSSPGMGAVFTIRLPLERAVEQNNGLKS